MGFNKTGCRITSALIGLVFSLVIGSIPPVVAQTGQNGAAIREAVFGWELTGGKVVSPGKAGKNEVGDLTQNMVWAADARAVNPETPIQKGIFQVTLSSFVPSQDMPGQKAGIRYLRGTWTIMALEKNRGKAKHARHGPHIARGSLNAELIFDPLTEAGSIRAQVSLPPSPGGETWREGKGTFSGNEKFEGTINLDVGIWPVALKSKGVKK